jgi:hypothetical protein
MPKREITVGVTVNLKNYESLRIEVEDDVESEEDVRSLVTFLDQTLALFGRGNAETEELITHYRKRVLKGALSDGAEAPAPAAPKTVAEKPVKAPKAGPEVEPPAPEPVTPEPLAADLSEESPPAPKPAPKPAATAPAKAPARVPAPSPTGAVCEECGAAVSAAEEKTSRLFVSRVLCKKCIQSL